MNIYTKLVCTLGPAVCSFDDVCKLIEHGMNVARLNFSHGSHEEHAQWIAWIKEARKTLNRPCAILADTKGNEIRIKNLPQDTIEVKAKDTFIICANPSSNKQFSLTSFHLLTNVRVGAKIVFGDGDLFGHFVDVSEGLLVVEMQVDGVLRKKMSCNIVGAKINFPILTDHDIKDIRFVCDQRVDIIAASFVSSPDAVMQIRRILQEKDSTDMYVIAKIESKEALENIESIIQISDGIMVARGDLGVELGSDIGKIPHIQKTVIKKAMATGKIVIVATQFLNAMVKQRQPTRAEVSDIVNAIYDGASALMLSAETASGKYPFQALKTMRNVIRQAESDFDYKEFVHLHEGFKHHISSAVALAAVKTAYKAYAKAIFISTASGFMARLIAKFRPKMALLALTHNERTFHKIAIVWGICPVLNSADNNAASLELLKDYALQHKIVNMGDIVVVTTGSVFGKTGATNMLIVENIGKPMLRAHVGHGEMVSGILQLYVCDDSTPSADAIIVLPSCSSEDTIVMQSAAGVIIANHPRDIESYKNAIAIAKEHNIAVVPNAEDAYTFLRDGDMITIDPATGHIYKDDGS